MSQLKTDLGGYPDQNLAEELMDGFKNGFSLHYTGPRLPSDAKNLQSVNTNMDIVREKITNEVKNGRMAGPFQFRPMSTLRVSPLGLIPKKTPGEFRLIHHLSYPEGCSVNDFIDPEICSVQYTSFDEAVNMVQDLGSGCLLGKADIKSAFRLLPISPRDFDQLGFKLDGQFYFDKCLTMGCSISCALFEKFATFIEYLVKSKSQAGSIKHYIDDFLFGGRIGTSECSHIMEVFFECTKNLGIPIAGDKTEWPTTEIVFLGLQINTKEMIVRIPKGKIEEIVIKVKEILQKQKVTLKVMQSLIGTLNFACRAIIPGRPFIRRLINATKGLSKPFHHLRITRGMKQDLQMWLAFFQDFNGVSVFHDRFWTSNEDAQLFTDSAAGPGLGFGAYFNGKWMYDKWPKDWYKNEITSDITVLELFPIVASVIVWGQELCQKKILFRSDNQAVVHILNTMSSKSDRVMVLVRTLTLECLRNGIIVRAKHISGKKNILTDCLSRLQVDKFRRLAPDAEPEPVKVPSRLWKLFSQE